MEWYRFRWQIELVFKWFKQFAELGNLPKRHDDSAKSWLYGKLVIALLTERSSTKRAHFPPGGIGLQNKGLRSRWREFSFALTGVMRAILPPLPLRSMIENWATIAKGLSEPRRERGSQVEKYREAFKTS